MADQHDNYLTASQAAAVLQVSREWFRKLRAGQPLPGEEMIAGRPAFRKDLFLPWSKTYLSRPKKRSKLMKR